MSTQPTGLPATNIIALDIQGTVALISQYNANAIAAYHATVSSWLTNPTGNGAPPAPITIQQVDQNALLTWYNAVQAYFASGGTSPAPAMTGLVANVPYPPDPRIAAALTAPTPPAQPSDPVGADQGNGYYGVIPGDTNPNGAVVTDSRGKFVKISNLTPFGSEVAYIKIS